MTFNRKTLQYKIKITRKKSKHETNVEFIISILIKKKKTPVFLQEYF